MDGTGTMGGAAKHGAGVDSELACPVSPVVDIVFSRWTTPILWTLNEFGRQRFVELQRNIRTITPKVLTQRLRQMERDGLVHRTVHPVIPPRVDYRLTELGYSLGEAFCGVWTWAEANVERIEAARARFDAAKADHAATAR